MNPAGDFQAVGAHVGVVDRTSRVRIEVTGPDRAKLLHDLTTNEVKHLPAGRGCEAFVTSTQGRTLAYTILLAADDRILVRSDPGGADLALPHFKKYGVFADAVIDDVSLRTFEFHVFGSNADKLMQRGSAEVPGDGDYMHVRTEFYGFGVRVIREAPTGLEGLSLIGNASDAEPVWKNLVARGRDLGVIVIDGETFEVLRIAAGTPVFGKDITDKNLPQEIGRDERAISFVKGCYLGQETVARLDAMGHVNQVLKGLRFTPGSPCPPAGSVLVYQGKQAGVVTSASISPVRNAPLALGFIRVAWARTGVVLEVKPPEADWSTSATVTDLSNATQA
jgi:folate-binding protein YgfZ